jgi:DNA-binding NarL/FixJ family response regulator
MTQFHPEVAVLVVSMYDESLYAERTLKAGARGYVTKRKSPDEILLAARHVLSGRIYVSEHVRQQLDLLHPATPEASPARLPNGLSDRELEVFRLLGQGFAPRHIAERLHLSVSTVEVYRQRLKDKLHLADSAELTRFAVSWWKEQPTF